MIARHRIGSGVALLAIAAGCTAPERGPVAPMPPPASPAPAPVEDVSPPATPRADERVPAFRVVTTDGAVVDSEELVGHRPIVLVFLTTCCGVCEKKLPLVRDVLEAARREDVTVLGVSIDDTETWPEVPAYLARHRLTFPVVRGREHVSFARAYDPRAGIPFIVVVGRDGYVVEAQMGFRPDDGERLAAAIELARRPAARE